MNTPLSEDEQFLAAIAVEFVSKWSPVNRFRSVRDERTIGTVGRQDCGDMAKLGWAGILTAEEFGAPDWGREG